MPTTLHLAHTQPINPPGAEPVLSVEQVWQGLERKVRHAEEFVPVINSCEVVSEEDNGKTVTREILFKEGFGESKKPTKEVCKLYYPTKVDFWQPDGALITNTISDGASGKPEDLFMTYTFEFKYPEIEAGSEQEKQQLQKQKDMGKTAVGKSIESIREMVRDGRIKA